MDVEAVMAYFGITSGPWLNPTSGTVVIAYALHKVFTALCEHSIIATTCGLARVATGVRAREGCHHCGHHPETGGQVWAGQEVDMS